ncbi:MAG: hypothetical protein ABEJ36_05725 [Candidatus Nanosalina sp.]
MKLEIFGEKLNFDENLVEVNEDEIRRQISEYLSGDRKSFDLDFLCQKVLPEKS